MMSQRSLQLSMRRLTSTKPSSIFKPSSSPKLSPSPFAIATTTTHTPLTQRRPAATTAIPEGEGDSILAAQRRHRPISPHLTIYRPQITWIPSMLNRITGITLSGSFYLFGMAYLAAPLMGWHLESASIAAAFATWPAWGKVGLKAFFAFPFTFHALNGLRHMTWDVGGLLTNKQVIVTGWTVVGLSVASALGLTFLL